jgi:hypothetical protein
MAGRSLDDVWRQMQAQRAAEQQRRMAEERAIYEQRERARQEYLQRMRMYEASFNPAAAAAAAAGAGSGGGRLPQQVTTLDTGDVALFYFNNTNCRFFIYNFENNTQTDIIEFPAQIDEIAPINNGGWYIKTVDGSGNKTHYLINISGEILWQDSNLSSEWDDYEAFSRYVVPYYEKDGLYYLVVMDSEGVREMTFDNLIDGGGYSYDNVHKSGFVAREENGSIYTYWIIPDGSTTPIQLKQYDTGVDSVSVYQYAYSDKMLVVTNNNLYEVYDQNAQLLASLDIDTITSNWSQYNFAFMSDENGSFTFFGYDSTDNNYIVVFFSGETDNFSHKIETSIDTSYDIDFENIRDYDSTQDYYHKSSAVLFYNNQYDWNIEGVEYSSDIKILPIWSTDEGLRDFFTFSYEKGIYRSYDDTNFTMFRSEDYITTIVDTGINQIYYFSDQGNSDEIDGGGYDMYDSGNRIYADASQVSYTHTKLQINKSPGLRATDFISDGVVATSSAFGGSSSYFTNLYPGLFVLCAQGTEINTFNIDGGLGADNNGTFDNYQYEKEYVGLSGSTNYLVSVKRVWGWPGAGEPISAATEPSVNHIIITKGTTYSGTTQSVGGDTNSDFHQIDNLLADGTSEIYYLLMSMKHGVKITDVQIDSIVDEFLGIRDNSADINELLTNLNSDYSNITSVLPQGSPTFSIMRFNRTGDTVTYLSTSIQKTHENYDEDRFEYGANSGKIVMQYLEEFVDTDSTYGWSDLSDVSSRNYLTLRNSADGNFQTLVSQNVELVMKDIVSDKYWAIKFTNWQGGGGGAFAYTRQLIEAGTFSGEIIAFTHSSYGSEVDIIEPGVLEITRGEYGPIYNSAVENESNGNNPTGTLWNSLYTLDYERVYHYLFNTEGVELDNIETYEDYENEWNGNVYAITEQIENITYVLNNDNLSEFTSVVGFYGNSNQASRLNDSGNPGIILFDNDTKFRLITNNFISSEISPILTGSYSVEDEEVCERGFVVVKENPSYYVFDFYDLSGNLVTSKQLPGNSNDYNYSVRGNRGKRLTVVWWNTSINTRNYIFFNGDSITEFESDFTNDSYQFNDYSWWY